MLNVSNTTVTKMASRTQSRHIDGFYQKVLTMALYLIPLKRIADEGHGG